VEAVIVSAFVLLCSRDFGGTSVLSVSSGVRSIKRLICILPSKSSLNRFTRAFVHVLALQFSRRQLDGALSLTSLTSPTH
jgi:hypothetical protein